MKSFLSRKRNSGQYAKKRMKLLLISERAECSPQKILMLKNDIIQVISKYMSINEKEVSIQIEQVPPALLAKIPLHITKDD